MLHIFFCCNPFSEIFDSNILCIKHESVYRCFLGMYVFGILIWMLYVLRSTTRFVIHTLLIYFVEYCGFSNTRKVVTNVYWYQLIMSSLIFDESGFATKDWIAFIFFIKASTSQLFSCNPP